MRDQTVAIGVIALIIGGGLFLYSASNSERMSSHISQNNDGGSQNWIVPPPTSMQLNLRQGDTCNSAYQCSGSMGCRHNKCEPFAKIGESCQENSDCESALDCKHNKCLSLSYVGGKCKTDDDCQGNMRCSNNKCYVSGSKDDPTIEKVSIHQLRSAFKQNEVRADAIYRGQQLRITGTIGSISKDILGSPHIWFSDGYYNLAAYTNGISASEMSSLEVGQTITVLCTCGSGGISITLNNCSL